MKRIEMLYGRENLYLNLPDDADVIRSRYVPGISDEEAALRSAIRSPIGKPPLQNLVSRGQKVVIVHSDITRATPNKRILPVLLAELKEAGIDPADITLINGLGTHRAQTQAEMRDLLGGEIFSQYRCLQHNCSEPDQLLHLGYSSMGHPLSVNKIYMEADIRILTGFIEPHLFAGFSGGPKAVLPSISGAATIQANHGYEMIAHPLATWGITVGNPIWEEMCEAALMTAPTFLLNVTLNKDHQITGVFAGDLIEAHSAGCDFTRQTDFIEIEQAYDIVLTTNSGYPLDQNLYQTGKGIKAAAQAVRPGGTIVMFCACEDGLPDHGEYINLLRESKTPQRMLEMVAAPGFSCLDQWQVQTQSIILMNNPVYIYSDGLTDEQICSAHYQPCRDVMKTLEILIGEYGPGCRIAVIPEGPLSIPVLVK